MNPYSALPQTSFWSRSVARIKAKDVDPVIDVPFRIADSDRIATAGSCFAQHIAKTLVRSGYNYYVPEPGDSARNFGVFPARFGNIYTTAQLLQLFQRAYGLFHPQERHWQGKTGGYVDPFRPQIEPGGFATPEEVEADRQRTLAATRDMFEQATVFVFTLGLTEGWRAKVDGAVVPLAPGVAGGDDRLENFEFFNASVADMTDELKTFISLFREVNPKVRFILTVSPVPLIATYEDQHVLPATIYSKSALRVTAEEVRRAMPDVAYFPSYEIITGPHHASRFFAPDLREVLPEGVDHVMSIFSRHFLGKAADEPRRAEADTPKKAPDAARMREIEDLYQVICDEEAIEEDE